jgi:hypothetical protein
MLRRVRVVRMNSAAHRPAHHSNPTASWSKFPGRCASHSSCRTKSAWNERLPSCAVASPQHCCRRAYLAGSSRSSRPAAVGIAVFNPEDRAFAVFHERHNVLAASECTSALAFARAKPRQRSFRCSIRADAASFSMLRRALSANSSHSTPARYVAQVKDMAHDTIPFSPS